MMEKDNNNIDLDENIKEGKEEDETTSITADSCNSFDNSSVSTKSISQLASISSTFKTIAYNTLNNIKSFIKRKREVLSASLFLLITSLLVSLIYLFMNQGTIPFRGDYFQQSMPYATLTWNIWRQYFTNGFDFPLYDNYQFLGVNNIGSNAFYYLFNPFYVVTVIFPKNWLLVLQGLGIPVKLTLAGINMYIYMRYNKFKYNTSLIIGLTYSLSGYMMFNIWFQFLDSLLIIPLIFYGIDRVIKDNKVGTLLLSFIYLGLCNYFYFCMVLLGGFMYAVFRIIQLTSREVNRNRSSYNNEGSNNNSNFSKLVTKKVVITTFLGFFSFLIPILVVGVVLLPSLINISKMPRMDSLDMFDTFFRSGFTSFIKNFFFFIDGSTGNININQTFYPLFGLLFYPSGSYNQNYIGVSYFDNLALNICIGSPLILITIFGIIFSIYKKKVSYIVGTILVTFMIFTPFCYYLFSGFKVGYSRFSVMPMIFMLNMSAIGFEELTRYKLKKEPSKVLNTSLNKRSVQNKLNKDNSYLFKMEEMEPSSEVPNPKLLPSSFKQTRTLFDISFGILLTLDLIAVIVFSYIRVNNIGDDTVKPIDTLSRSLLIASQILVQVVFYIVFRIKMFSHFNSKLILLFQSLEIIGFAHSQFIVMTADSSTYHKENYSSYIYNTQEIIDELNRSEMISTRIRQNEDVKDSSNSNLYYPSYRLQDTSIDSFNLNKGLYFGYQTLHSYSSNYPFEAKKFLEYSHLFYEKNKWRIGYEEKRIYLDMFLGIKYYLVDKDDSNLPSTYTSYLSLDRNLNRDGSKSSSSSSYSLSDDSQKLLSSLGLTYSSKLRDLLIKYDKDLLLNNYYVDTFIPLSSIGGMNVSNLSEDNNENFNEYHLLNTALYDEDTYVKVVEDFNRRSKESSNSTSKLGIKPTTSSSDNEVVNTSKDLTIHDFNKVMDSKISKYSSLSVLDNAYVFKSKPKDYDNLKFLDVESLCDSTSSTTSNCNKRYEIDEDSFNNSSYKDDSNLDFIKTSNNYGLNLPVSKFGITNDLFPVISLKDITDNRRDNYLKYNGKDDEGSNPSDSKELDYLFSDSYLLGSKILVNIKDYFKQLESEGPKFYVSINIPSNIKASFYKLEDSYDYDVDDGIKYTINSIINNTLDIKEIPVVEDHYDGGPLKVSKGFYIDTSGDGTSSNIPDFLVLDIIRGSGYQDKSYPTINSSNFNISVIPVKEVINNFEEVINYSSKVTISNRNSDFIRFKTDFDTSKVVLLNIPYSDSWSLTKVTELGSNKKKPTSITREKISLYPANGGMLSYLDIKEESDGSDVESDTYYELSYVPKGFNVGKVLTITGIIGTGVLLSFNYYSKLDLISKHNRYYLSLRRCQNEEESSSF